MAARSSQALKKHFGNHIPETIIEPGRGMVGNAGVIKSEVVLISKKTTTTIAGSSRHRQVRRPRRDDGRGDPLPDPHRARWRRDGALRAGRPDLRFGRRDVREEHVSAAVSLSIGDEVLIEGTGAYTTTYSAVAFNGFEPLKAYVI
jgi:ornithine decarboxylase